jgi:hypothetical protein
MAVATLPLAPEAHEAEEIARKVKLVDQLLCELRDEGLPSRRLAVSFPGLQERFDPHELRLSAAGTCPRLRAARLAGLIPPEQPDEVDAGYFLRGRLAELVVRAAFARCYRRTHRRERARGRGTAAAPGVAAACHVVDGAGVRGGWGRC